MLVPAAHVPTYGVASSCHTGTWASATVVCRPPKTAVTFSRSTSSRAIVTPFCGLPSSSRTTSSSLRPPSTPPLAFTSSMAICRPRLIASPEAAEPPDTAAARPSLIVACWAAGAPASATSTIRVSGVSHPRLIESLLEQRRALPALRASAGRPARLLYADFGEEARDRRLHVRAMRSIGEVAAALDDGQLRARDRVGYPAGHRHRREVILAAGDHQHRAADARAVGQPLLARVRLVEQREQRSNGMVAQPL